MAWFSYSRGSVRRIERTSDWINRAPRKRKQPKRGRPVGPRLVRGRGLARRRFDWRRPLSLIVYLLLAAGLTLLIFRTYVTGIIG